MGLWCPGCGLQWQPTALRTQNSGWYTVWCHLPPQASWEEEPWWTASRICHFCWRNSKGRQGCSTRRAWYWIVGDRILPNLTSQKFNFIVTEKWWLDNNEIFLNWDTNAAQQKVEFTYPDPGYGPFPDPPCTTDCTHPIVWTYQRGTWVSVHSDCVSLRGSQRWHCGQAYQGARGYQAGHGCLWEK